MVSFPQYFPPRNTSVHLPHPYATHPCHLILLDLITRAVQLMKLLLMHFSPVSCYLVPLKSKYLPRHPTVKHAQPTFFPRNKGHPVLIYKIKFVAHRKQSERVLQIPARDCCAWKQIQNAQGCVKPGGTYGNPQNCNG